MQRTISKDRRFLIVIPALNEEKTIEFVVTGAIQFADVLVVDDGSSDDTGALAKSAGAHVASNDTPRGYEASISTGLAIALSRGYQFAITMDADGQHSCDDLPRVMLALCDGIQVVTTDRTVRPRLAEKFFCVISNWLWGIPDPLSGLKGYNLAFLNSTNLLKVENLAGAKVAKVAVTDFGGSHRHLKIIVSDRLDAPRYGNYLAANIRVAKALLKILLNR